jgi:hypothetical protein
MKRVTEARTTGGAEKEKKEVSSIAFLRRSMGELIGGQLQSDASLYITGAESKRRRDEEERQESVLLVLPSSNDSFESQGRWRLTKRLTGGV